jgi:hypothetical protein
MLVLLPAQLLDELLKDEHVMDVIGCLEYDPDLTAPQVGVVWQWLVSAAQLGVQALPAVGVHLPDDAVEYAWTVRRLVCCCHRPTGSSCRPRSCSSRSCPSATR